ncbi:MAG: hypothetical protein LBR89_05045 [Holosporales bacterium]|jgi:cell shape-determining protein MreD|nr:hypothetical protein [Holosporales bacterium]
MNIHRLCKIAVQTCIALAVMLVGVFIDVIVGDQCRAFRTHMCIVIIYLIVIFGVDRSCVFGIFLAGFAADQLNCVPLGFHSTLFLGAYIFISAYRNYVKSWKTSLGMFVATYLVYYAALRLEQLVCGIRCEHAEVADALATTALYVASLFATNQAMKRMRTYTGHP